MHPRLAFEIEARKPHHLVALRLELARAHLEPIDHEALKVDDAVPARALLVYKRCEDIRVLAEKIGMRAKKAQKKIDLTEGIDPTSPARFREHGGSLWFRGKGPERHPLDPSRRKVQPGGAD